MSISEDIKNENDHTKIGFIVSVIVIGGSLIPNISSTWITISNEHSLFFFTIGIFIFMLSMGIKVNMKVQLKKDGDLTHIINVLPDKYTNLSISLFLIALLFLLMSILSFIYVL